MPTPITIVNKFYTIHRDILYLNGYYINKIDLSHLSENVYYTYTLIKLSFLTWALQKLIGITLYITMEKANGSFA